jgi:hypothetical protein
MPRKAQEGHLEEVETTKANKRHERRQNHENSKRRSKPNQKLKINTPHEINSP